MDERLLHGVGALAAALPADPSSKPQLRVLVVEDNLDSAQSMHILLKLLGHEVRVAHTGPEGLELARVWDPDVMLCDIGLPGLDGWAVARQVRGVGTVARPLLVAVTAYGTEEDRECSRAAGFDHHLVKPLDLADLLPLLSRR